MMTFLSIVAAIFGLGVLILVHEWAHFVVARLCGVRVEEFAIGFGKRLWGWEKGPTDYRINLLPFGGYVRMAGDNPAQERAGAPDEFLSKPRWERFLIALAGPTMNVLLAFLVMWGLFAAGMPVPAFLHEPAKIASVAPGSPAALAGIQGGDEIVAVDGKKVADWDDIQSGPELLPATTLQVELKRQSGLVTAKVVVPGGASDPFALLGYPANQVVVDMLVPGSPAEKGGLRPGDEILSIGGEAPLDTELLAEKIRQSGGKPVSLLVRRGGNDFTLVISPKLEKAGEAGERWVIGAYFGPKTVNKSYPVPQAAHESWSFNVNLTREIFQVLVGLFDGKVSLKELAGPVGIVEISTQSARQGPTVFLRLMAFISINLGILNLLPIPILDGGHILMLGIEGTLRRELSLAVKERFVQVGLVFLLGIIAFVTYYDVLRLLPGH